MSAEAPPGFAELVAATNFSFLHGASQPSDMVGHAIALGLAGIGIADRNTVAGVVRAHVALKQAIAKLDGIVPPPPPPRDDPPRHSKSCGWDLQPPERHPPPPEMATGCGDVRAFRLVVGARLVFADGTPDIVAYPADRHGWGRLTRLLTVGNRRAEKGGCILRFADLLDHLDGLLLIVLPECTWREGEGAAHRKPPDWDKGLIEEAGAVLSVGNPSSPAKGRWSAQPDGEGGHADVRPSSSSDARAARHLPLAGEDEARGVAPHLGVGELDPDLSRGTEEGEEEERQADPPRGHLRLVPSAAPDPPADLPTTLSRLAAAAPDNVWLGATMPRGGRDRRRLAGLAATAAAAGVPLIATNDALYAEPGQRQLHDVVTCIREGVTVQAAGRLLQANGERYLKPEAEMRRLFRDRWQAVDESMRLLARIDFRLDQLGYEYPHEPVPYGRDPMRWLKHLVIQAAFKRFPGGVPNKVRKLLFEEFRLIADRKYAYYFLTVHDIVAFARSKGILCQGRGSAANSAVCYLLGITSVDPVKHDLLFSRFVSAERDEPPDIDVDFEHERREEVMQYIYRRYGRHRAGIAGTVIHYRPRSTVREVGKVLGFTDDVTSRLASTIWGSFSGTMEQDRYSQAGFTLDNPEIARLAGLVDQLLEFPRHLSQHVGGFVLTQDRLDETVPIHNGAMPDRTFIEWDKDDIDALGLMKVDVLALGMLTCIEKAFGLMRQHGLGDPQLDTLAVEEDPRVYDMLCQGDSVGVFQVESRAQINMLPRLKPRELYDLVVQVAIVRPGPIEGDMVHPYLRRRAGKEPVEFPSPSPDHGPPDELRQLLGKTFGVPLFQEQAMKLAIVAARFTPDEANQLRRAMATFRHVGGMHHFQQKLVGGMVARGYDRDFAERCYSQIEGFGSYGFPESHAQSFARLVYVSSWIKCYHPAVFACAILNSQPMGFYAPAQLVRDAIEHGVEVRALDVNASGWDNALERGGAVQPRFCWKGREWPHHPDCSDAARWSETPSGPTDDLALRLGLRQIDGFRQEWAQRLVEARAAGPFPSIEELARRARLPARALRLLADADAFRSMGMERREALWDVRRTPSDQLPLFAAAEARELREEAEPTLPPMPLPEHVAADYQTTRLSLKGHPMQFLRPIFAAERVLSSAEADRARNGARIKVAGVVLVRQRPGKGRAIFVTLEDETGITNVLLWARVFERHRAAVMGARLMLIEGEVQRSEEGVVHLIATRAFDRSGELGRLSEDHSARLQLAHADIGMVPDRRSSVLAKGGHPRDVRILPPSRDFH